VIQSRAVNVHDRIRLGVSGAGLVAQTVHLPLLRELGDRFVLDALAEPSPRVRAGVGARYGFRRTFADVDAMLDARGLDAVLVCSPNGAHAPTVLGALAAGLHVLVEKPLCLAPADADRIAAAARIAGRVVQVGTMKRFDRAYERLLEELPADEPLRHLATVTYDPWLPPSFAPADVLLADDVDPGPAARLAADTAAQVAEAVGTEDPAAVHAYSDLFLGALIHDVNLVHGVLDHLGLAPGEPVDATVSPDGALATGAVALGGGRRWTMAFMLLRGLGDFRERLELFGDAGVRRLEFPAPYLRGAPTRYERIAPANGGWSGTAYGSWDEPYLRQLVAFHASVTVGAACRTPPEQARRDVELLAALFRHARLDASEAVAA
jgi:predicted dehydrogenase